MIGTEGPVEPKLFTYLRYMDEQRLWHIRPRDVQRLDSTEHMQELTEVGRAVAKQDIAQHFEGF